MITAGIDAGSRSIKVVLFDMAVGKTIAQGRADQGVEQEKLARDLFYRTCADAAVSAEHVKAIVATGYGRNALTFATSAITEITCHARGVHHLLPDTRTVIEIGGQDSKWITLLDGGRVRDFAMNDRCAAGSGRFLEVAAQRLGLELGRWGQVESSNGRQVTISSMCVVFAETEIVGLLAEGTKPEDIATGVQNSIASRVAGMGGRMLVPPVTFTGGVALQSGMVRALEKALACPVRVAPEPQFTGALGAAILASKASAALEAL